MIEKLKTLHGWRKAFGTAKEKMRLKQEEFAVQNKDLLAIIKGIENEMANLETGIRQEAIKTFQETGNKAPFPGVGIREKAIMQYPPDLALEWALEHKLALALDVRAFEAAMKATKGKQPPFVSFRIEAQGTIAQDLGPYVQEPDVQPEGQASSVG